MQLEFPAGQAPTNNQCRYFLFFGHKQPVQILLFFGHKQSAQKLLFFWPPTISADTSLFLAINNQRVLLISWPPTTSIDTSYFLALNNQRRYFFFLPTNNHHRYFSFFGQSAQVLLIFWPVTQLQILYTTNADTKDALDKC